MGFGKNETLEEPAATKEEYAIRLFVKAASSGLGVRPRNVECEKSQPTQYRTQRALKEAGILKERWGNNYELGEAGEALFETIKNYLKLHGYLDDE